MIASALAPAAISDYANHLARHGASNASIQQMMRDSTTKMMGGTYAAPPWSASLEQAVRQCIRASLVNAVQVWDLQVNCPTPDLDALRAFLDERFRHFTDDLPPDERDLFPWE